MPRLLFASDFSRAAVLAAVLVAGLCGCNSGSGVENGATVVDSIPEIAKPISPTPSGDTAYAYVEKQVSYGPRVPNSAAHKATAAWMESTLKRLGATVVAQRVDLKAHDGKILKSVNLIGSYNMEATTRVALFAHWDSRPYADNDPNPANHNKPVLGANDGASGVAVLLELARQMQQTPPPIGVDLILVDAEDYGKSGVEDSYCLGSQYWAKNPHVAGYKARFGILLDMVGAPNALFPQEGTSLQYAKPVVDKVWGVAGSIGLGRYFSYIPTDALIDDHYYINKLTTIPTIDIIHMDLQGPMGSSFPHFWHTVNDDMTNVDPKTLGVVAQALLETIWREKP